MGSEEIQQYMRTVHGVIICVLTLILLRGSLCALTREEIISVAQSYAYEPWTCNKWNIEPSGDDESIDRRPNWPFSAGNGYNGVPYVYGGKDSTATFKAHIAIPTTGYNYIAGKADDEIEKLYKPTIAGYAIQLITRFLFMRPLSEATT